MKILYIVHQFYPEFYTGTEKFVLNISTSMKNLGHEVKVITHSFYKDSEYKNTQGNIMIKEYIYKGIPVKAIRYKEYDVKNFTFANDEKIIKDAEELIMNEKPDLVHIAHTTRVEIFAKAVLNLKIPYIMTLTDYYLDCFKGILLDSSSQLCKGSKEGIQCKYSCPDTQYISTMDRYKNTKELLLNARKVLSPSKFLADYFMKAFEGLKVGVLNHGINYDNIKENNKTYKKGDKIAFCYAGSIAHHKGVRTLLEAFNSIKSKNFDIKLYGSDPFKAYEKNLKKDFPKFKDKFYGVFSEEAVGDAFKDIDVVIVPSLWYENYPLVLHEALACNVPVITTNIGGMAEKIIDGINGITFERGNSVQLKNIVESIIEHPEVLNILKKYNKLLRIPTIKEESSLYELIYKESIKY